MEPGQIYCTLTFLLQERGISLNKLAKDTGIAYTTLHRLATNKLERVDLHALGKVCDYLGVVPGDILRISGQDQISTTVEPETLVNLMIQQSLDAMTTSVAEFEKSREERLGLLRDKLQAQINEYIELESNLIMDYHRQQTNINTKNFMMLAGTVLSPEKHQEFLEKQNVYPHISLDEFNRQVTVMQQVLPASRHMAELFFTIWKSGSIDLIEMFAYFAMVVNREGKNFDFKEAILSWLDYKKRELERPSTDSETV